MLPGSGDSDPIIRTRPQHNTDCSENTFAITLAANKNEKKAVEHEKTNAYELHHPFKPRIGPCPGHLVYSPSAIRRVCGEENMTEAKMMERCQE